ncbi:MAG TPA: outer membrane beta-barrel protein [Acidobacteriaceae bacterium]|jgi:opacity protein-like surface antigen|nr:outer membrane beta-barrel protein [Acidobacteriaceae bacterium]
MKKTCLFSFALAAVTAVSLPPALHAQATAAATRGGMAQVGVAYTTSNQDEFKQRLQGVTIYGTFDLNNNFGLEGDVHMMSILKSYYSYTESSYDVGLRYVRHYRSFSPYAKGLIGFGHSQTPSPNEIYGGNTPGTYMLFALGGGLDYGLTNKINIRIVDFEYQRWPNFPPHGLTPAPVSFGIAYRLR